MKKICFFNKPESYIIVAVSGIIAGLLVAFFSRFPFVLLRFAPALCILAEAVLDWIVVAQRHRNLFMALVETACAVVYLLIILNTSEFAKKHTFKNRFTEENYV